MFYGDTEDTNLTLEELTDSSHVLTVHAGEDDSAEVVAAGNIEGTVDSNGNLTVTLNEVEDSALEGRASFGPHDDLEDDDDEDGEQDETEVVIGLWQVEIENVRAKPAA